MKTQSQKTIDLVAKLAAVIESRKAAEKAEKELKEQVREILGEELVLEAGEFAVLIEERSRRDLDKEAINHDMGAAWVQKYTKVSSYEILTVKATARKIAQGE